MSIQYCYYCDQHIDTDFNAEHFDSEEYECIYEEQDND